MATKKQKITRRYVPIGDALADRLDPYLETTGTSFVKLIRFLLSRHLDDWELNIATINSANHLETQHTETHSKI